MDHLDKKIFRMTIMIALVGLTACNFPKVQPTPAPTFDSTVIIQTLSGQMTQLAVATTPVLPFPTPLSLTQAPEFATATRVTPLPSSTPACNRAMAGNPIDVTIPDDTVMQPGETFTKTWRLVNSGDCTWSTSYALIWFSGERFNAPIKTNLRGPVGPGQAIDISVEMTAPSTTGTYQSNWKLQDATGVLFGIGPLGDSPFWVRIVVAITPTITPTPTASATATATPTATPTSTETASATP
jgi:hypothetical protein